MEEPNYKNAINVITILHWTITTVPIVFAVFTLFMHYDKPNNLVWDSSDVMMFLPPITLLLAISMSRFIFKSYVNSNMPKTPSTLSAKLAVFQTAHLLRLSIFEVAMFMAVIVSFNSGTIVNLGFLVVGFVFTMLLIPSISKIEQEIELTAEERELLEG